jgi:hypothetical protein
MTDPPSRARAAVIRWVAPGTVLSELADMVADSLVRSGADVEVCTDGRVPQEPVELAVLIGFGPEFRTVESLWKPCRHRPDSVVMWLTDPLPPPGLSATDRARGLNHARAVASVRGPDSRFGDLVRRLVPATLKRRAVHRRQRGSGEEPPRLEGVSGAKGRSFFNRLEWVVSSVGAGRLDHVYCAGLASVEVLAEIGVSGTYAPFGYHPWMGLPGDGPRDIEVCFLGNPDGPRRSTLMSLEGGLRELGVNLITESNLYGEARNELVRRSQIQVSLSNHPWFPPLQRFFLAAAGGALVVSDPTPNTTPFVPGRHYIAVEPDAMAQRIVELLRASHEREQITSRALRLVHDEYTMDGVVGNMLKPFQSS